MSLSGIHSVKSYTASASQVEFEYPYAFFADSDIKVSIQSTAGVISTPTFTVAATNGDRSQGGTITLSTGATLDDKVTISREVPITQEYDLQEGSTIDPKALNTAFDRTVAQNQQQQSENQRSVLHPIDDPNDANGTPTLSYIVPSVIERKNKILSYDNDGNVSVQSFSTVAGDAVTGGNGIDITANSISVDNSTDFTFNTGKLALATDSVDSAEIKADAVDTAEIKNSAVTTAKLPDSTSTSDGVTLAKLQHIATNKILGRTTASDGDVELLDLKDEDTMSSNSATSLATQQSIKAYASSFRPKYINISGTSGSTAISFNSTSVHSTTHTFTLSELTGSTGLDSTKFNTMYISCFAQTRRTGGTVQAIVSATMPDGTDVILNENQALTPEDSDRDIRILATVPINEGQTSLVLKTQIVNPGGSAELSFTIRGVQQST
jgi:hypothetical protein